MEDYWYVYGAGGLGTETMDILEQAMRVGQSTKHECCFVEDNANQSELNGYAVIDFKECVPGSKITIAVGEPAHRIVMHEKVKSAGLKLASIISPDAFISPSAVIEAGVIVAPQCSVQANALIEENAAINTMTIIGHDVKVQTGAVISSMVNLGGGVNVGANSYIGMGALVQEGLTIGSTSIIGMGSVVYKDIPDGMIALGNPARVARRNDEQKVFK